jgi:hypothetical protein
MLRLTWAVLAQPGPAQSVYGRALPGGMVFFFFYLSLFSLLPYHSYCGWCYRGGGGGCVVQALQLFTSEKLGTTDYATGFLPGRGVGSGSGWCASRTRLHLVGMCWPSYWYKVKGTAGYTLHNKSLVFWASTVHTIPGKMNGEWTAWWMICWFS